ncbi:MAG: hypothetical protein GY809_24035, partial [Planctomycetes bacterium]|nr:hypothetical protein [Planctomycetota bacterium]
MTGTRTLPSGYLSDPNQITVTLDVEVDENEANLPLGVIIVETLPAGWKIISASPPVNSYISDTQAKWVFFDSQANWTDENLDITYTIGYSPDASGEKTFSGDLKINVDGVNTTVPIAGDTVTTGPLDGANAAQCVVSATSPVPADNTSVSTITLTVLNIAGNP